MFKALELYHACKKLFGSFRADSAKAESEGFVVLSFWIPKD
jgi:hypothetical protein